MAEVRESLKGSLQGYIECLRFKPGLGQAQLSMSFLGKSIEGIWHTGVSVYGNEYYFGGGIQVDHAGSTPYGTPLRVVDLGVTHLPKDVFEAYLHEIGPRYTAECYNLLTHNCNNFSNEIAQFLVGTSIPEYILNLPKEIMSSPMGALMMPMIQQLESTLRSGAVPRPPQFSPSGVAQPTVSSKASIPMANKEESSKKAEHNVKKETAETLNSTCTTQDTLGSARSKVQEEISSEFAALMATGAFRASEAAAMATRRVMQRYGQLNTAQG